MSELSDWKRICLPSELAEARRKERERLIEEAPQIMLRIVNEWHRQVGIDEVMKTKLTRAIADTVATGVIVAAIRREDEG